jgi:hypothetical protein
MNRNEIREEVIKKFHEWQQIPIRIEGEGKRKFNCTTAKIVKFNPSTVLTEHDGYKESFTYWDFMRMTTQRVIKQSETIIPEKIKSNSK